MSQPTSTHILDDVQFAIVAAGGEYAAQFTIYKVVGSSSSGAPLFQKWVGNVSDCTESLDQASPFCHGYVKWDGCSNWHFDQQDGCMLHFCSRADLAAIGEVLSRCWDLAKKLCARWDAEVAE